VSDECVQYLYLPNGKAFNSIFHKYIDETTNHWNRYIYIVNIYNLYEEYVYSAQKRLLYIFYKSTYVNIFLLDQSQIIAF
jgi:hypothetical protein